MIIFGAVLGREGAVSGKFNGGTLANLWKSPTVCPFFGLGPLSLSARAFHSRTGRRRQSDCTLVHGKVCLWQSKQRWQALQEVLQFVSDLEKNYVCFVVEFTLWNLTEKEPPSLKVAYRCFLKAY